MAKVTIYHNPRCTKSRQTLALLRDHDVEPTVVEYLKEPLDAAGLRRVLKKLGIKPAELLRRKEAVFKDLGLKDQLDDDDAVIAAIAEHPVLMERPIVVSGNKARIGRPPEQVLEIL